MEQIKKLIAQAQQNFKTKMIEGMGPEGLTQIQYLRFLTGQYHLTKGVQRHFYKIASHSDLAKKKSLRSWLIQFAHEEEFHFSIAEKDAQAMGKEILGCPLDVKLWWLYFDSLVEKSPFIRLGATCILENISDGSSEVIDKMLTTSSFLNKENTRFLTIHRHGPNLDHGNQIVENLEAAELTEAELDDLIAGCEAASTFYLRLMHWMLTGQNLR